MASARAWDSSDVEVSIGGLWQAASLIGHRRRHSWQWWEPMTRIDSRSETTLRAGPPI